MKRNFPIIGMACSQCSAHVEHKLQSLPGVKEVSVSLPMRSALVDYDEKVITPQSMKKSVNDIGYDMVIDASQSVEKIEARSFTLLKRRTALSWILALAVMSLSMGWLHVGDRNVTNQTSMLLALINLVVCGQAFYRSAVKQMMHLSFNMDSLVALSTAISFVFSVFNTFWGDAFWGSRGITWNTYYDASVMIITFVLTGRLLEEKAKNNTASSLRRLMGMAPKTARIVTTSANGKEDLREVPVSTIVPGDELEVRAGERIPVDGEVVSAESFMKSTAAYVDESMINGEPIPAEKAAGAKVLAGTIPSQGKLRMKARQVGQDTAIAGIIRMVQQAQSSKAPVQRIVDKAAMVFVPVVMAISLLTFIIWYAVGGSSALPHAILSAVAVLVIACPCAMGLATPTALMVGIGKAAEKQILIKDASALENLHKVDALVTDKTGTLTIPNENVDFTKSSDLALTERETLKPHAREAMEELKSDGVDIYLMSGDKEEAVAYWAKQAGIDHYKSKVMPDDKENMVKQLQQQGKKVAMAGDGINDTQALALADVSIAMAKGTDVSIDIAQVTLIGNDLRAIPEAVKISRQTVHMIWQNLFWAFIYNIVCIPLAAGITYLFGYHFQITPQWASALMAMSSVSVVLNSLRLKLMR